jgi:hypothetical protein
MDNSFERGQKYEHVIVHLMLLRAYEYVGNDVKVYYYDEYLHYNNLLYYCLPF